VTEGTPSNQGVSFCNNPCQCIDVPSGRLLCTIISNQSPQFASIVGAGN
jgi:hypothetical protein